eukprot:15306048-Ditylum_brightwellii.AAC.2
MEQETQQAAQSMSSFSEYLDKQPQHDKRLLGTLLDQGIDPVYWIQALNEGKVTVSLDAKLNVEADTEVNYFQAKKQIHFFPSKSPTLSPSLKVLLTIEGNAITGNIQQWLRESHSSSNIAAYIQTKTGLSISDMKLIDQDNLGRALE